MRVIRECLLSLACWILGRYFRSIGVVKNDRTGATLALIFAIDQPTYDQTFTVAPRTPQVEQSEAVH